MLEILVSILILLVLLVLINQFRFRKIVSEDKVIKSIIDVADSKLSDSIEKGNEKLNQKKELIDLELKGLSQQVKDIDEILKLLKSDYKTITSKSLQENSDQFVNLTQQQLRSFSESGKEMIEKEGKLIQQEVKHAGENQKKLSEQQIAILEEKRLSIGERIEQMEKIMKSLSDRIEDYEKFNTGKFQELNEQIKQTSEMTQNLGLATNKLIDMLRNTKQRGQFGEQIAEDVLRFAGLMEHINYEKQASGEDGGRPDFKFILPEKRYLIMDVKFPLNAYQNMFESNELEERKQHEKQFLIDVKNHVKSLASKNYISDKSLDYLIMFIPNEAIFSFINEKDPQLSMNALQEKIIICSPLTLFAVLGIVKQSINNYKLHQAAQEIQNLMNRFYDQWKRYSDEIQTLSKQFNSLTNTFEKLNSTRRNQLEKELEKIKQLQLGENQQESLLDSLH